MLLLFQGSGLACGWLRCRKVQYASLRAMLLLMCSRCLCIGCYRLLSYSKVFQMSYLHRFITSVMSLGETRLFRWINSVIHISCWLIVLIYCADRIVFLLPWPQSSTSFVTTVMTLSSIFSSLAPLLLLLRCFCEKPISRFKFPF